ncbi:hypothetical protein ACP4OV_007925 [Aristida adscensionis]
MDSATMAASAPAPAPAVVDARFCALEATAFAVTKTISATGRDFAVTDVTGAAAMQVEAAVFAFRVQDSGLFMSTRWEVFRADSTSRRKRYVLFAVVRSSAFQVRTKICVLLAGNAGEQAAADFVVRGSYYDGACTVSSPATPTPPLLNHPPKHRRGCTAWQAYVHCEDQPRHRPRVHPGINSDSGRDASPQAGKKN